MDWIYTLDLIGTMVFAISGVLTAIHNKFDVVGSFIIGIVTAVGGGTLRDILIGETPVGWMKDANYLWVILLALILAYAFRPHITRFRKGMFLFDTIGIGLFTILGLQKTLGVGLSPGIAVMMGTVSAVFGGVIRHRHRRRGTGRRRRRFRAAGSWPGRAGRRTCSRPG